MRFSARSLRELVSNVVRDPDGFPLAALYAAIGEAEGGGDPEAWVAHDPPRDPSASPSSGLYQVHQSAWPAIYAETESIRLDPMAGPETKVIRMTEAVRPIMDHALDAAASASRILHGRGKRVSALDLALFVDAVWQTTPERLEHWARSTSTGNPREIVNEKRTNAVEVALRSLGHRELNVMPGAGVALLVIGGLLLGAALLSQWEKT